jgi:hypothetical protein
MTSSDELEARVRQSLLTLPASRIQTSRWGKREAYVAGTQEVAHLHGPHEVDIRLTWERIRDYRAERPADPRFRFRPQRSDWVVVRVSGSEDLPFLQSILEEAVMAHQ